MAKSFKPKTGFMFFCYDSYGEGMVFFDSLVERDRYAQERIKDYCEDGEWSEDVKYVCTGMITGCATQVDREDRPQDPEQAEEDGWPADCDYRCNYRIEPL